MLGRSLRKLSKHFLNWFTIESKVRFKKNTGEISRSKLRKILITNFYLLQSNQ